MISDLVSTTTFEKSLVRIFSRMGTLHDLALQLLRERGSTLVVRTCPAFRVRHNVKL